MRCQWQLPKHSLLRVKQLDGVKGDESERPEAELVAELCSAAEALEIGHRSRGPPRMTAERAGGATLCIFDSWRWWGDGCNMTCHPGLQQPFYG